MRDKFRLFFSIPLLLGFLCVYGNQQDSMVVGKRDSISFDFDLKGVVVTGTYPDMVPTTNTSQILNLEKSDRMAIQDVSDAVRRMAGAEVKDYGGVGGLKTVSVRGLGSKHTTVCYDGIPVTDCQNGQVDLGRFSLDQLDRMELQIGDGYFIEFANAFSFASTSMLNLLSVAPLYHDKNYHAVAKITGGSFGLLNPYISFDHKIGNDNSIKASADFVRSDGNYPYTLMNGTLKTEEIREHSASASGHGELSGYFRLSSRTKLCAKAYYYVSDRELPGGVVLYNTGSNETLKDKNAFAQVSSTTYWSNTMLRLIGKFNWNACYYHDEAMKYPGGVLDNRYFQREWYGSAIVHHKFTEHLSFANATDYALNSFNSNIYDCVFPQRHTLLDALSGKYENDKVTVTATLLGSFYFNQVEIGEAPDNFQHLSPSITVSYQPFSKPFYLRASYKDIFRMPTFNELYFNSFGARSLEPEKTKQFNVGKTYKIKQNLKRLKSFAISADYYFNKVDDKIVYIPKMFVWSIMNMGYVEIKGLDFMTNFEIATSERTSLFLTAKYAYQNAVDLTNEKSDIYGHQIPYTPKHSGNCNVAWENPIVNVAYNVNAVGRRYSLPQNIMVNRLDAYTEHDITLYRTFKFDRFDMKLRGDIMNITNKQYEIVRYYPMPGRSFKASVEFKF